jgi:hypothetical protein
MEPQFKRLTNSLNDDELSKLVEDINKAKPLLEQGLLRESELFELYRKSYDAYEGTVDHDSIQYRKYDKDRREHTVWREVSRSGYVDISDAADLLMIQQQIIELLNLHSVDVQPTELFISPGSDYTARFYIRNVLSRAAASIDIKDDYLFSANKTTQNIDLLWILQPYVSTALKIDLRLLGDQKNPPNSTAADIKAFMRQNPTVLIRGNAVPASGRRETHDRFIIIDHKDVFKIGASIKDLGSAQTSIDIVNDPTVSSSYVGQFETWWSNARPYTNLN